MPTAEKTNLELGNPNQGNPEPGKGKKHIFLNFLKPSILRPLIFCLISLLAASFLFIAGVNETFFATKEAVKEDTKAISMMSRLNFPNPLISSAMI